jgi:hypothetical protein
VSLADCEAAGGSYLGNNTECDACPPPGACCLGGNRCTLVTQAQCEEVGGDYLGINTECTACPPDCNDNSIPDGEDIARGTSQDCNGNMIPDECDIDPTDPDGDGQVSEDTNPPDGIPDECQQPPPPLGIACCLPDGTCVDLAEGEEADCEGMGGTPQPGDCSTVTCYPDGCDPNEPGLSLLLTYLFRGPVCGMGCPAIVLATFAGLVTIKARRVLRRRRRR